MEFMARKFSRAKWGPEIPFEESEILTEAVPADAVTACLRTSGNRLSMWQFDVQEKQDLEEAVLALASYRSSLPTH